MKPTTSPPSALPAPDPKAVANVRLQTTAVFSFSEPLPGERDHNYLPQRSVGAATHRLQELGRPTW